MDHTLSEEQFCECIDEILNVHQYHKDLNKLFEKYKINGCIYPPDCTSTLVKLIKLIMGVPDNVTLLEDYCFTNSMKKINQQKTCMNFCLKYRMRCKQ